MPIVCFILIDNATHLELDITRICFVRLASPKILPPEKSIPTIPNSDFLSLRSSYLSCAETSVYKCCCCCCCSGLRPHRYSWPETRVCCRPTVRNMPGIKSPPKSSKQNNFSQRRLTLRTWLRKPNWIKSDDERNDIACGAIALLLACRTWDELFFPMAQVRDQEDACLFFFLVNSYS